MKVPTNGSAGHNLPEYTALLIDDDPANLGVISDCLLAAGLKVLVARDGESGLQKAHDARPHIILLDVVMPSLDGFEICRRLKADVATQDIPVLFMTALTGTRDKIRAYEAGAVDFVTKPLQVEELLARVRAHLALHSMTQHLQDQGAQVQQAIAERERADAARQITEAQLRTLIDQMPFDLWAMDEQLRYILQNAASRQQNGDVRGKRIEDLDLPTEVKAQWLEQNRRVLAGETLSQAYDLEVALEGAGKRHYENIVAPVKVDKAIVGIVGMAMDVTQRKQTEEELRLYREHLEERVASRTAELRAEIEERTRVQGELSQVNRMLKLISECNQVLVRATDEAGLLEKICRVIVELGGYRLAWVGLAEPAAAQTIRPAAQFSAGDAEGAARFIGAKTDLERRPVGVAIRSGQPCIVNDVQTDPRYAPWRAEALRRGYASVIAVPLKTDDRAIGALNIYAAQPQAFHPEEVNLLMELASDLAYGVLSLRARADHQQAEAALAGQHRLLRTLIDAMPDRIYVKDTDSRFLLANNMVAWVMGVTPEEAIGKRDFDFYPPDLAAQYYADEQALLASGQALIDHEEPGVDLAGNPHWVSTTKVPFRDEQGKVKGFVGIGRDITVRKEMEHALRQARDELETRVEERTRELRRANEQLAGLYRVAQTIAAPLQLKAVLDVIARSTAELLGSDTGVILLLDEAEETLTIAGAYGLSAETVQGARERLGDGIAGRVVQTRLPIIANDLPHDPRFFNPAAASEGLLACASVPLIAGGRIIGTLDVHSKTERQAFTPDHIQTLSMLASQSAIAIENARLYERLQLAHADLEVRVQQRTAELLTANAQLQQEMNERQRVERARAAIYRLSESAQAASNLEALFASIHASVSELMPAKNFYIALYEAATAEIYFPYYADEEDTVPSPLKSGRSLTDYVLRTSQPLLASPEVYAELVKQGEVEELGAPSIDWLGVPLKTPRGEALGVMAIQTYTEEVRLTEADRAMLVFVSGQVAMAIERKRTEARERDLARNLRAVVEAVDELIACTDLDTFFRRAVELAREKLGVERSALFLLDDTRQQMIGTYGTDLQGRTTDEHAAKFPPDSLAALLNSNEKLWMVEEKELMYRDGERRHTGGSNGWVATTVIRLGGEPIGLFSNDTGLSHAPLNEVTQETLAIYCSLLGNIIEHKRAEEQITRLNRDLEHRTNELAALNAAGRLLASTLDLDQLLSLVMDQLKTLVDAEAASVLLCVPPAATGDAAEDAPPDLEFAAVSGPAAAKLIGTRLSGATGIAGWVVREKQAVQITDSQADPRFYQKVDTVTGMTTRSLLAVPLIAKGTLVGVMEALNKRSGAFDAHDLEMLEALSNASAIAIENARLYASEQQRAAVLSHALEQQRELDRLQREFIQNVSHELRTPIGIILGYAELLESGELGELHPDQREPIRIITRRVHMLRKLVEDITAILEIEARVRQRVPLDLGQLIQAAIDEFQITAEKARLTLAAEIDPEVSSIYGDAIALRRVLDNLVNNAFKFTPAGGRVTLRLRSAADKAILEVSDTGIGIAADKVGRIFNRFYQVDGSATRHYGGMGLGLALVKEIVEAHGGQIEVTSTMNVGTTFTLTLPVGEQS